MQLFTSCSHWVDNGHGIDHLRVVHVLGKIEGGIILHHCRARLTCGPPQSKNTARTPQRQRQGLKYTYGESEREAAVRLPLPVDDLRQAGSTRK